MSWASSEVVSVLVFLLPGFVAAAVFYSLTSYPKPNEFGQVTQALVFTMVGQSIAWTLSQLLGSSISWSIGLEATVSVLSAVVFALVVAYFSNNDTLHGIFRRIGLTKESSYLSEWYSAFAQNPDCYVILNLKNGRRLFGWPEEWPSRPGEGHFLIVEAEWLEESANIETDDESAQVFAILVPEADVELVEFLKPDTE